MAHILRTFVQTTILLGVAAGCNNYELFQVGGYEQSTFSNDADIIFVIDNSNSMELEASELGLNFNTFIDQLTNPESGAPTKDTLSDAVDNYVIYTTERGRLLDYQLGITTPSVLYDDGPTAMIDPGEHGFLLGDPTVITDDLPDVGGAFRENLLCDATCWSESTIPSDPSYVCGDDPGDVISGEYLDCICGFDEWQGKCGTGQEEHLEAALLALCRAVPEPPEVCFDGVTEFDEDAVMTNPGILRDDSTIVMVIVTDEGDGSRRLDQGDEDATPYIEAFADFERAIRFAVIGPTYDVSSGDGSCLGGATTWGTERLMQVASETRGFYQGITTPGSADCEPADFGGYLVDLGDLLNNLLNSFQLAGIPDENTIRVYVDGESVDRSDLLDGEYGATDAVYGDGWSYDPSENSVAFWGAAVPDYNSDVRIYYRPLGGVPRELPI